MTQTPDTSPETNSLKAYTYHVSGQLSVHADITVEATSQEEALSEIKRQLGLRDSPLTDDLTQSAATQIRKEMDETEFDIELDDISDPDDDDPDDDSDDE